MAWRHLSKCIDPVTILLFLLFLIGVKYDLMYHLLEQQRFVSEEPGGLLLGSVEALHGGLPSHIKLHDTASRTNYLA